MFMPEREKTSNRCSPLNLCKIEIILCKCKRHFAAHTLQRLTAVQCSVYKNVVNLRQFTVTVVFRCAIKKRFFIYKQMLEKLKS